MTEINERDYPGQSHFLPYLLNRVVLKLNVDFQLELKTLGLTFTQWRVLAFLHEQDGLSIMTLSDATATEASTLSRALVKMEQRGWIRRVDVKTDRRSTAIRLQAAGQRTFEKALTIALKQQNEALSGIPDAQLQALRNVLGKIEGNLDRVKAAAAASTQLSSSPERAAL